jgi:hypothetical protein
MDALDFEGAIGVLGEAEGRADVPAADRLEALALLVQCQLTLEHLDEARSSARRLFTLDGGYVPPAELALPHRVSQFLDEIRAEAPAAVAVSLDRPVARPGAAGGRSAIEVTIARGAEAVQTILFRIESEEGARSVEVPASGRGARLEGDQLPPGRSLRLELAARAPSGTVLARLGPVDLDVGGAALQVHPSGPSRSETSRPPLRRHRARRSSIVASPWFWTAAGVLVAATVTVVALSAGSGGCHESLEPGGKVCFR